MNSLRDYINNQEVSQIRDQLKEQIYEEFE